jgi:hypothetical protein
MRTNNYDTNRSIAGPEITAPRNRAQRRPWLPAALYLLVTAGLGTTFYERWKWALPDVPYLSQLTAISAIESALDGNFSPLFDSFFRFEGEHKLWAYYVYLYANARLESFSTTTEIAIWTISTCIATLVLGWYAITTFKIDLRDPRMLLVLIMPVTGLSTAFFPGRGMETQVQLSTTVLVLLAVFMTVRVRFAAYVPIAFAGAGIYTMLLASSYFAGLLFALCMTSVAAYLLTLGNPAQRARLYILTLAVGAWGVLYLVMLRTYGVANSGDPLAAAALVAQDPLYVAHFFLNASASTVLTLNTSERLGEVFVLAAIVSGLLLIVMTLVLVLIVSKSMRARRHLVLPFLLLLYPIGISIAVFLGRSSDPNQLLNIWYSFHFRLGIYGIVLLAIIALTFRLFRGHLAFNAILVVSATFLAVCFGTTWHHQWQRNSSERIYFLNIRQYVLHPDSVSFQGPLTPIYLDRQASEQAIRFLKRHHFVPYHQ